MTKITGIANTLFSITLLPILVIERKAKFQLKIGENKGFFSIQIVETKKSNTFSLTF